jgi:serine/threonine protein kinase
VRILKGKIEDIQKNIPDPIMADLIHHMVRMEPQDRMLPAQLLKHLYFWESHRRLRLICELSNYIETYQTESLSALLDTWFYD